MFVCFVLKEGPIYDRNSMFDDAQSLVTYMKISNLDLPSHLSNRTQHVCTISISRVCVVVECV